MSSEEVAKNIMNPCDHNENFVCNFCLKIRLNVALTAKDKELAEKDSEIKSLDTAFVDESERHTKAIRQIADLRGVVDEGYDLIDKFSIAEPNDGSPYGDWMGKAKQALAATEEV